VDQTTNINPNFTSQATKQIELISAFSQTVATVVRGIQYWFQHLMGQKVKLILLWKTETRQKTGVLTTKPHLSLRKQKEQTIRQVISITAERMG